MSTFNKTISYEGYNPFTFKAFEVAKKSDVLLLNIQNPILFSPTKLYNSSDAVDKGYIWNAPKPINFSSQPLEIENTLIDYNSFIANIKNTAETPQWLLLNQNYHHLWKAHFQKNKLPIFKVNDLIMGVEIPPKSEGKITFQFESNRTIYLSIISIIGYFFIGIYLVLIRNKQINNIFVR